MWQVLGLDKQTDWLSFELDLPEATWEDIRNRPRQMILYTGLQSHWPKATLKAPEAGEQAHCSDSQVALQSYTM
jgi:hypothetical protein